MLKQPSQLSSSELCLHPVRRPPPGQAHHDGVTHNGSGSQTSRSGEDKPRVVLQHD